MILVEQQGQLRGLITIKDILKEIITHEQEQSPKGSRLDAELEESLEEAQEWLQEKFSLVKRRFKSDVDRGDAAEHGVERPGGSVLFDATNSEPPSGAYRPSEKLGNAFEMSAR